MDLCVYANQSIVQYQNTETCRAISFIV